MTSVETAADLVGASAGFPEVRVSKLPRQRGSHRCQRIIDAAKFGDVGEMIARVIGLADDLLDRLHRLDVFIFAECERLARRLASSRMSAVGGKADMTTPGRYFRF